MQVNRQSVAYLLPSVPARRAGVPRRLEALQDRVAQHRAHRSLPATGPWRFLEVRCVRVDGTLRPLEGSRTGERAEEALKGVFIGNDKNARQQMKQNQVQPKIP